MTTQETQSNQGKGVGPSHGMRYVLVLVAIYLILATVHAFVTPIGFTGYQDAPDEGAHISYVNSMHAGLMPDKTHPHAGTSSILPDYEWHQPPLYYKAGSLFSGLSVDGFSVRFLSILAGIPCIILIYLIALEIRPDSELTAVTAAGIAALTPGHISILSTVNNDGFLELFMCLCAYAMVRMITRGPDRNTGVLLGVSAALAVLSKATGLILLPAIFLSLLLAKRCGRNTRQLVQSGATCFVLFAVIAGWWFARNFSLYHELIPLRVFRESFSGTAMAADVVSGKIHLGVSDWAGYWALVAGWCFRSFWAVYGTSASAAYGVPLFLPDTIYMLLALLCLGASAGMGKLHFQRLTLFDQPRRAALYVLFTVLALTVGAYVKFASEYFQTQGRYIYPAMAPVTIILAMGWVALFPARYRKMASAGFLGILALVALIFALQTSNRGGLHPPVPQSVQATAQVTLVTRSGVCFLG